MDISLPASGAGIGATRAADDSATVSAATHLAPRVGAFVVLLGTAITTIGLSWDIQWHTEVGPDTFFTLSHLALYSGSALSGIASLVMVLMATSAQRAGRPWSRTVGGPPVRVFGGAFSAPLGYLVSGVGAASFLLYGLLDLWWHSIYGFDAVTNTPSHVALFLSITVTMVGAITVFTAARARRWGRFGVMGAVAILISFVPLPFSAFSTLPLPVDPTILGIVLCAPLLLITGALVIGRGGALGIAVTLGALQAFLWWFSPWASVTYANAIGLPLRDGLTPRPPAMPNLIPMFLIAAALLVEAAMWVSHRKEIHFGRFMFPVGGLAGLIVGGTFVIQLLLTHPGAHLPTKDVLITTLAGLVMGPPAGFLATRFATMLRGGSEPAEVA